MKNFLLVAQDEAGWTEKGCHGLFAFFPFFLFFSFFKMGTGAFLLSFQLGFCIYLLYMYFVFLQIF